MKITEEEYRMATIQGCRSCQDKYGHFSIKEVYWIVGKSIKRNRRFYLIFQRLVDSKIIEPISVNVFKFSDEFARVDRMINKALEKVATKPITIRETAKLAIEHLNNKAGKRYKVTPKVLTQVSARYNEGFRVDDFLIVIDKKIEEWGGTKMEIYIRPDTLFGNKFQGYLNQTIGKTKIEQMQNTDFDRFFA